MFFFGGDVRFLTCETLLQRIISQVSILRTSAVIRVWHFDVYGFVYLVIYLFVRYHGKGVYCVLYGRMGWKGGRPVELYL